MKHLAHIALLIALALVLAGCMQGDGGLPLEPGDGEGEGEEELPMDPATAGIVARIDVSEARVRAGMEVEFDASGTQLPAADGNETEAEGEVEAEFEWDLGDGRQQTGVSITHTYEEGGVYLVTLVVRLGDDAAGNATLELRVLPPERADLNEEWSGSFPLGAPVEASNWIAQHDFTATEAQSDVLIDFSGSGAGASFRVYLFDADGEELGSDASSISVSLLPAGSYTVKVHMTGGASGSYELTATGTATLVEESDEGEP